MARILTPETLALFLFFVVPGFVTIRAFDLVVPTERRSFGDSFIDLVSYSFLILAIWFLPYFGLVSIREFLPGWLYYPLLFLLVILVVIVSPVMLAYWYYVARTEGFLKGTAKHPSPTSWDYFFDTGRVYWVKFYLKTGEQVGGYFGENSFASTFPNVQQIYVEELYKLDEQGVFSDEPLDATKGAIINREDCDYIEFLEVREAEEAEEDQQPSGRIIRWVRNVLRKLAGG